MPIPNLRDEIIKLVNDKDSVLYVSEIPNSDKADSLLSDYFNIDFDDPNRDSLEVEITTLLDELL